MNFLKKSARRLIGGIRALSPNCREASRLQSDALERPLSPLKETGLRIHLVLCQWCRRYGKQIRLLRQAVREQPDQVTEAAPSALSPEARARFKRVLQDETK
jgi:hypothetical protein